MAAWSRESSRINRSRQSSTAALGFLDILEKGEFAVITAPAAGFEQLREVIEPLLGKSAPASDNVATARHVQSLCHKLARKEKNGRGRNGNESI